MMPLKHTEESLADVRAKQADVALGVAAVRHRRRYDTAKSDIAEEE